MKTSISKEFIKKTLDKLSFLSDDYQIEYVEEGYSTDIFRLLDNGQVYYLRIAPKGENFSSEFVAHKLLLDKGVEVPKILYAKDFNQQLGRSLMITTEIKGASVKELEDKDKLMKIVEKSGEQLALANSIPVKGFGWLDRTKKNVKELNGIYDNYEEFAYNQLDGLLKTLVDKTILDKSTANQILKVLNKYKYIFANYDQAYLAHGDFDAGHIYQDNGNYSGIIDWGDIRATSIYHDLAHFETFSPELFKYLIAGYQHVKKLPKDYQLRISLEGVSFAIGKLWWTAKNRPNRLQNHRAFDYINKKLDKLK